MASEYMSLIERALALEEVERVPVAPLIAIGHASRIAKVKPWEYALNPEVYVKTQLYCKSFYDYDWVWAHQFFQGPSRRERESLKVYSDYAVVTLDFGARIKLPLKGPASTLEPAVKNKEDIDTLEVPELNTPEKMSHLKLLLEKEDFVAGNLRLPFTFASTLLYNLENFLIETKVDKEFAHKLIDFAYRYDLELATALIENGAGAIYLEDPSASSNLISPQDYREFAYPYQKKLIKEITKHVPVIFHICGNISPIIEDILSLGITYLSIDENMDIFELHNKIPVWGNVAPSLLVSGSPEEIEKLSSEIVELRKNVILSSGCVVPANAKAENIKAMVRAAKKDKASE